MRNIQPLPASATPSEAQVKLVDAQTLREVLWDERSRPSLRSLRAWTAKGTIPSLKLGRLVYYDPASVLASLKQPKGRRFTG